MRNSTSIDRLALEVAQAQSVSARLVAIHRKVEYLLSTCVVEGQSWRRDVSRMLKAIGNPVVRPLTSQSSIDELWNHYLLTVDEDTSGFLFLACAQFNNRTDYTAIEWNNFVDHQLGGLVALTQNT